MYKLDIHIKIDKPLRTALFVTLGIFVGKAVYNGVSDVLHDTMDTVKSRAKKKIVDAVFPNDNGKEIIIDE